MDKKKFHQIAIAAIAGILSLSTAKTASAAGSFFYPAGQVVYNYTSPSVSIYGAIQVGGSPSANVTQNSTHNLSVIGQTGNTPMAKVTQMGALNAIHITQVGQSTNALAIQFGHIESLIGQ